MTRNYEDEIQHLLRWFDWDHLPPHLAPISQICQTTALSMVEILEPGPELLDGLNRLLESKDWFVRQAVDDRRREVDRAHYESGGIDRSPEYECIRNGGHYWMSVPVGENNRCSACGAEGARNVPEINEEGPAPSV
jgi:hypothetical protein